MIALLTSACRRSFSSCPSFFCGNFKRRPWRSAIPFAVRLSIRALIWADCFMAAQKETLQHLMTARADVPPLRGRHDILLMLLCCQTLAGSSKSSRGGQRQLTSCWTPGAGDGGLRPESTCKGAILCLWSLQKDLASNWHPVALSMSCQIGETPKQVLPAKQRTCLVLCYGLWLSSGEPPCRSPFQSSKSLKVLEKGMCRRQDGKVGS